MLNTLVVLSSNSFSSNCSHIFFSHRFLEHWDVAQPPSTIPSGENRTGNAEFQNWKKQHKGKEFRMLLRVPVTHLTTKKGHSSYLWLKWYQNFAADTQNFRKITKKKVQHIPKSLILKTGAPTLCLEAFSALEKFYFQQKHLQPKPADTLISKTLKTSAKLNSSTQSLLLRYRAITSTPSYRPVNFLLKIICPVHTSMSKLGARYPCGGEKRHSSALIYVVSADPDKETTDPKIQVADHSPPAKNPCAIFSHTKWSWMDRTNPQNGDVSETRAAGNFLQ